MRRPLPSLVIGLALVLGAVSPVSANRLLPYVSYQFAPLSIFTQPAIWELYRWQTVGAVSLIVLQSLLIVGLLINRTKRRRAEAEVRLSETRFRDLADSSPIMIWIADTNMLCTYFNKQCLDYTQRSLDE